MTIKQRADLLAGHGLYRRASEREITRLSPDFALDP
jgi:hypothetical protein